LAGSVLSVAVFFSTAAQAMEISQFDKMVKHDQGGYAGLLVQGTLNILKARNPQDAQKFYDLFSADAPGQKASNGIVQFKENLEICRQINKDNGNDPNKKPLEVEDALWLTLKNNGIIVPIEQLLEIGKDFKPSAAAGSSASIPDKNPAS
jgi:hypothetical protein